MGKNLQYSVVVMRVHKSEFGNLNTTAVANESVERTYLQKQIFVKMSYQNQRKLPEKVLQ